MFWASLMPGGEVVLKRRQPMSFHLRRFAKVVADRNFLRYLIALSLVGFGSVPLGVFVPLFLKEKVGMSASTIVLLQNGALLGTLASSYFWGWAADRFGSKPVIISGLCLLIIPPLGWLAIPYGGIWSIVVALVVFVISGVASIGYSLGTSRQLYVTIVPDRRKTHYMSIFCAWMGASNGMGQLLAGQSMDLATGVTGHVMGLSVNPYTFLFLFSILMLVVGLILQRGVDADGSMPAGQFVAMFFQGNPLTAMESLFRYSRAGRDIDRVRIIRRLGNTRSPLSADELADALADLSFNVRYEAVVAIARSRHSAQLTSELIETLIGGQPELSIEAAWALGRIGGRSALGPLRWTFSSGGPLLQLRSARALASLGDQSIVPELKRRIDSEPDLALRRAYASTLQLLTKRGPGARADFDARLKELRRKPTVKRLLGALADPDFDVQYEAVILTSHRRPDATLCAALVRILEDGESDLSIEAALALGRMKDPSATDALMRAFESGHPLLQARCARALAAMGESRIVPDLRRRMAGAQEAGIRIAYASALGELQVRQAMPDIFALLDVTPHQGWVGELHLALGRLVDERLFIRLWRQMRKEPGTGAARFLHGSLAKARRLHKDAQAMASALQACIHALGREDLLTGCMTLAEALEALPTDGKSRWMSLMARHCALRLRQSGPGRIGCLPLSIIFLHVALNR
jgi:HEAT repeat protein